MNTRTDYLTRAQIFDVIGVDSFGVDSDERLTSAVDEWNSNNDEQLYTVRKPHGCIDILAHDLPDLFVSRLDELESIGVKYTGDINGPANATAPEPARIRENARELWHGRYPPGLRNTLSLEVVQDIKDFIAVIDITTPADVNGGPCEQCATDYDCCDHDHDCYLMQLTVACNETGTEWSYQTGDNSYSGGAYSLPHWAVVWIGHDDSRATVAADIIDQLNEEIA